MATLAIAFWIRFILYRCLLGLILRLVRLVLDLLRTWRISICFHWSMSLAEREPETKGKRRYGYRRGDRQRRKKTPPAADWKSERNLQRPRLITQRTERLFELLDLRINFAGAIPK